MTDTQTIESLIHVGLSLVFCPNRAEADRIQAMCERLRLPYVNTNNGLSEGVNFATFRAASSRGVLISVVPQFSVGFRFDVHRVVWIGAVPIKPVPGMWGSNAYAVFVQSMARGGDANLHTFEMGHP
jgi:hypothetical protein